MIFTTYLYIVNALTGQTAFTVRGVAKPPLADSAILVVAEDGFVPSSLDTLVGDMYHKDTLLGTTENFVCVFRKLEQLAKDKGANLLSIVRREPTGDRRNCSLFVAKCYRSANSRAYEKKIEWSEKRRLVWDDFKKAPPANLPSNVAALTNCGFGFNSSYSYSTRKMYFDVWNEFLCFDSWVKNGIGKSESVLRHEQGHFDLCEIYTRLLRKRLLERNMPLESVSSMSKAIFNETYQEFQNRQTLYDNETNHGLDAMGQAVWFKMIDKELLALNVYAKPKCKAGN